MQKVTKEKKSMWKQTLLTLLLPEPAWVIFWDFFPFFYNFPGWLNFSVTLQIQKQTMATDAHLSQQSQNHTLLFSPPAPPSTPKSQSWGHCSKFCTVQPVHYWDFATWGCQLQKTHQNQNDLRHHCLVLGVICVPQIKGKKCCQTSTSPLGPGEGEVGSLTSCEKQITESLGQDLYLFWAAVLHCSHKLSWIHLLFNLLQKLSLNNSGFGAVFKENIHKVLEQQYLKGNLGLFFLPSGSCQLCTAEHARAQLQSAFFWGSKHLSFCHLVKSMFSFTSGYLIV